MTGQNWTKALIGGVEKRGTDCDDCGETYTECTDRVLDKNGACCPACGNHATHNEQIIPAPIAGDVVPYRCEPWVGYVECLPGTYMDTSPEEATEREWVRRNDLARDPLAADPTEKTAAATGRMYTVTVQHQLVREQTVEFYLPRGTTQAQLDAVAAAMCDPDKWETIEDTTEVSNITSTPATLNETDR